MTDLTTEQKLTIAIVALESYAHPVNWGETASFGNKRQNRFLGKGNGFRFAQEALTKIGVHHDYSDAAPEVDLIEVKIDELIKIADGSNFKAGWVFHQLENDGYFPQMSRDHWSKLGEYMDCRPAWAYMKHQEHSAEIRSLSGVG